MRKFIISIISVIVASFLASKVHAENNIIIDTNILKVREQPEGTVVGRVHRGQQFKIVEAKDKWAKVQYGFKKVGWIHTDYTRPWEKGKVVKSKKEFCKQLNDEFKKFEWSDIKCNPKDWEVGAVSSEGNPILFTRLDPVKKNQDGAEAPDIIPTTLLVCSVHSDEHTLYQCFRLLDTLKEKPELLINHLVLVPLLNPDGFVAEEKLRTNANGVDLNRNMPTHDWHKTAKKLWQKKSKKSRYYPGKGANSEPENQFLITLLQQVKPDKVISIHAPLDFIDLDYMDEPLKNEHIKTVHDKAKVLAMQFAAVSKAKFKDYRTFPGSLGRYGDEWKIPVYTLELPSTKPEEVEDHFERFRQSLLLTFRVILGSHNPVVAQAEAKKEKEDEAQ